MNSKYNKMVLSSIAIAINIVIGNIVAAFQLPFLFLDTIGTIFIALIFGPIAGMIVGALTNLVAPILMGRITFSLYILVSIAVGLVAGVMFKKMKFNSISMIIIGIAVAAISAFVGSWIKLIVFDGYSGELSDAIFSILTATGLSDFLAMFITRFSYNVVDKILSCFLVYLLYKKLHSSNVNIPKIDI